MRRLFIIACSAICLCVMHSCSSMYYVKKNEEYTKKMAQNIVKKRGMRFFWGREYPRGLICGITLIPLLSLTDWLRAK